MRTNHKTTCIVTLCASLTLVAGGCGGIVDEKAEARFRAALGNTSITVFPAFIRDGQEHRHEAAAAKTIADFLTRENLATATISDAQVPITSKWGMNQAKMFRGSAADFSAYVGEHHIETDYALLTEYLISGGRAVGGVHVYLVDAAGTVAYGALLNSHWKEFNDVNPKTTDDCTTIVINKLRLDLARRVDTPAE